MTIVHSLLLAFLLLGVIVISAFIRFYSAKNHLGQDVPFYSGNFTVENPLPETGITVVTYNIWYGKNIDQALTDIKEFRSQKNLDILLLQEMDEQGIERLAKELQLNYVYFPAAIEPKYKRNFGNAVLSRWEILDARKIILPHISLSDRMKRIAARATIRMQEREVIAYSIHTEPVFILPKFKEEQCFAILDDIDPKDQYIVVGGDFNSFTEAYAAKLEERYSQAGFVRASKDCGPTFGRFGRRMFTDQIFTKGFIVEGAGKVENARASDHLPIWTTLRPE